MCNFYISETKVVDIKVRDQILSNFDEYNLVDLSSNDWYITVHNPGRSRCLNNNTCSSRDVTTTVLYTLICINRKILLSRGSR